MMQDSTLEAGGEGGGQMVVRGGAGLDKGQETHYRGLQRGSGLCSVVKGSVRF